MPRGFLPISKVNGTEGCEVESSDSLSPWLRNLVNKTVNKETAVEQSRKRQSSIVNQVNNLMKNPPRYATVADAVQDMRQRTGLDDYISKIKQAEKSKLNLKCAADIVSFINKGDDMPEIFSKYECADDIINFVKNTIDSQHGSATVPQLQHDVYRWFNPTCGITSQELHDESVATLFHKYILEAQAKQGPSENNPSIGLRSNEEPDAAEQDYFGGLNPAKIT